MISKSSRNFMVKGGLGYIPLDDAVELYHFEHFNANDFSEEEKEQRQEFLDSMDVIASKYLNPKEFCIYNLVVHEKKRTSDITVILNYNGWRTSQNSIDRVFKILNLYYDYEAIDKEELYEQIDNHFNKLEKKIIRLLEERFTIQQINSKLGKKFHYTRTHSTIKGILFRLEGLGDASKEYYNFLIAVRKFKDSCNFNERNDKIEYKNQH